MVAFRDLKKGADLVASNKGSSLVTWVVWQAVCLVWKAGRGVEVLGCGLWASFQEGQLHVMGGDIDAPCSGIKINNGVLVCHLEVVE